MAQHLLKRRTTYTIQDIKIIDIQPNRLAIGVEVLEEGEYLDKGENGLNIQGSSWVDKNCIGTVCQNMDFWSSAFPGGRCGTAWNSTRMLADNNPTSVSSLV